MEETALDRYDWYVKSCEIEGLPLTEEIKERLLKKAIEMDQTND